MIKIANVTFTLWDASVTITGQKVRRCGTWLSCLLCRVRINADTDWKQQH